jgi:hypothetical protein
LRPWLACLTPYFCGRYRSLYCSEKCRSQDCGDASASNSNSSVAPSSASSSPSRASSNLGWTKQRPNAANGHNIHLKRHSGASSGDSSPSLHTSDLPEYSDDDVEIEAGYERRARVTHDASVQGNPFRRAERPLDHAFWKSRYADIGPTTPTLDRDAALNGSKSVPGAANTLHYIRKPGPINVNANTATSKLVTGLSPYRGNHGHKRYGSEYGYSSQSRKVGSTSGSKPSEALPRQGSAETAASSTPTSKAAAALSSSATRLQTTASESTLGSSVARPAATSTAGAMRHVSDTVVHTLRRTIEPLTAFEQVTEAPPAGCGSSHRTGSVALAALKDVARSHGMMEGGSQTRKLRAQRSSEQSNVSSIGHPPQLQTYSIQTSNSSTSPLRSHPGSDLQESHSLHSSGSGQVNVLSQDEFQEKGGRGRSRKRGTPSRSPSPPSWASWEESEPIDHRRGRSARRGQ